MPANLPPTYHEVERRYRQAAEVQEKIAALEEMLRIIPKHKGTDKLQGDLKARLSKLRRMPAKRSARASHSMAVPPEGAGQIVLVGPPNGGKSSLVRALTNARVEVAPYPGSTRKPSPGMMAFEDIAFQLVDMPPVTADYNEHWLFDILRRADLVWLVLAGARPLSGLELVEQMLTEKRILLHPLDQDPPQDLDFAWTALPTLMVITGADLPETEENLEIMQELLEQDWPQVLVSATIGTGLDRLPRRCFEALDLIRVYTKQPGKPPDLERPFALRRGATVGELAQRIHKDLARSLKSARIWGTGVYDGQTVHRTHELHDKDVLEIRT